MAEMDLAPVTHSLLGPSGANRWLKCSAAPLLSEGVAEVRDKHDAAQGTVAHAIVEKCILEDLDPWEFLGESQTYEGHVIDITTEMTDHLQKVVDRVRNIRDSTVGMGEVEVEVKLHLPGTPIYGYSDYLFVKSMPMHVADLKYGVMYVEENSAQLGLYGLMALLREHDDDILINGADDQILVVTEIIQPRSTGNQFRLHQWSRAALRELRSETMDAVKRVERREKQFCMGEHCRFCRAVPICPALRNAAKDAAMATIVTDQDTMPSAEDLDRWLALLPVLKLWQARLEDFAYKYMQAGGVLSEAKLVDKRPQRAWADAEAAEAFLRTHGVDPYASPKMLSPPQAEKKLTKDLRPKLAAFVSKESSGVTMAMADDKRPSVDLSVPKGAAAAAQQTARRYLKAAQPKKETE